MGYRIFYKEIDLNMYKLIGRIPLNILFRLFGRSIIHPINLTISVTNRCNFRCKTCNIIQKKSDELSLSEWQQVFKKYGNNLFWATFSGGEPFLRRDIDELVCSLYDSCHPKFINIPTNGFFSDIIPQSIVRIAHHCTGSQIILNISLDDIGERHDAIRGIVGSYKKVLETFHSIKSMNLPNVSLGFHTVISKYNVQRIPQIYYHVRSLNPDSYVTEIAEERAELNTIGSNITPEYPGYFKALDFLISKLKHDQFNRVGKITRVFREEYYRIVKKTLSEHRQIIPCYSGFASAQIAPNGDVWFCCIKAEPIGNLKEENYDFFKIWHSKKGNLLRKSILQGECFCPLANASYTNIIHNIKTLTKVSANLVRIR